MASTVYVDNQQPAIGAAWLNDVNTTVYGALGGATTAAAARTALALSPASSPTFANVNVPVLGLVDGRDVSVDGAKLDTIAAGSGPSSNSFVNIAVATQGTVIATSPTDTLTLTTGANIGITTTPGTDTIAFAVTGTVPSAANSNTVGGLTPTQFARVDAVSNFTSVPTILGQTVWTAGNDGSGSGLDADLLDGFNASQTATASTAAVRDGAGILLSATPVGIASDNLVVNRSYYFANLPAVTTRGTVWTAFTPAVNRLLNTPYTNTSGKTIVVNVSANTLGDPAAATIQALVGAIAVGEAQDPATAIMSFTCSMEVVNGATYQINTAGSGWTLLAWAELL